VPQVPGGNRELDHGPDQDADRVGVDPVVAGEGGREQDEDGDDRDVPEERRNRERRESAVAVEDPDDHPADPEQDQDREEDLREVDGEVEELPLEPGGEERHQQRRGEDEDRGDRPEHHRHQEDQLGGEPERLAPVALLELLDEDWDEGRLDRGVGEQAADEVGDLEGDRERRHRPTDPEVAGCDDLPHQAGHPREGGGD
jgi:hypothetical protein